MLTGATIIDRRAIRYVTDLGPAAWIRGHLHPFAQDAGSVVPAIYDDYARVFHPAARDDDPVTWRAIAEANGRTVHPEMQFGNIAGAWRDSPRPDVWTRPPTTGTLSAEIASALADVLRAHTTTPERCWFAVWEGWGGFDPGTPRFDLPGRRYFLATGPIDAAASSVLGDWTGQSPSMWWPDDRTWFVSTEIDFTYTYVGGTRQCIDAILDDPRIEALRARSGDRITWDGDRLNASPGPPYEARAHMHLVGPLAAVLVEAAVGFVAWRVVRSLMRTRSRR
ncbi:MAG TPA: hypothetical protein VFV20_02190 [Candidatus Limnocylindria bacterium]|nr:hypothetical protein [Candidatus Limnocylindria bacterium]